MTSKAGVKGHIEAKGHIIRHPKNVEPNTPTEGPYRVRVPDEFGIFIIVSETLRGVPGDSGEMVVATVDREDFQVEGEAEANARLLASSHNLKAELFQFVSGVDSGKINSKEPEILKAVTERARVALLMSAGEA